MVPFVLNESARITGMHFCAKAETLQVDSGQKDPYFEVTIPNLYSWQKILSMVYNLPMFGIVYKKSHFLRQTVKNAIKICLVLRVRPTKSQNQNLRPLPNLFQFRKSNENLRIGK